MLNDKASIRKQVLEKRDALTPDMLDIAGKTAADQLALRPEYRKAETVMLYMDFRNEVPTRSMIDRIRSSGKKLVLPYTSKEFTLISYEVPNLGKIEDYLICSEFGIFEPDPALCKEADANSIDLVVVPGSVFDVANNRIGYGKGCYDRFLSGLSGNPFKLGLAYDFQMLSSIPTTPADVKMDRIIIIKI